MFFNLETGEESEKGNDGLTLWRSDENVFFAEGRGMNSVHMDDVQLEELCILLHEASLTDEHIATQMLSGFYAVLEAEDEGTRNLCFISYRTFLTYNLEVKHFPNLIKYLRERK